MEVEVRAAAMEVAAREALMVGVERAAARAVVAKVAVMAVGVMVDGAIMSVGFVLTLVDRLHVDEITEWEGQK